MRKPSNAYRLPPGTSLRMALRHDIKNTPNGTELVLTRFGWQTPQTIANYTCDTKRVVTSTGEKSTHTFSLDQIDEILELTGGRCFAQAAAELAGGVALFFDDVDTEQPAVSVVTELLETVVRVGELGATVQAALADNRVDAREMRDIRQARRQLVNSAGRLAALCELLRTNGS
jgi:hypothetical protein